jgi:hypothetical protein
MPAAQQFYEPGDEVELRIIDAEPHLWYANRIGDKFKATSFSTYDNGTSWYSLKEPSDKNVRADHVEAGNEIGKTDLKAKLAAQQERIQEQQASANNEAQKQLQEMMNQATNSQGSITTTPSQTLSVIQPNNIQSLVADERGNLHVNSSGTTVTSTIVGVQTVVPPKLYAKPRVEYDWDVDLIKEDMFITARVLPESDEEESIVYKGMVTSVTETVLSMVTRSGDELTINIADYRDGKVVVKFPELS